LETIIELLKQKISEVFIQCGCPHDNGLVTISDRPDLCQFQCDGAFAVDKQFKKAPHVIAN
jgi:arginyl-tRNA synthetase